jgi:hypothetical protein
MDTAVYKGTLPQIGKNVGEVTAPVAGQKEGQAITYKVACPLSDLAYRLCFF